MKIKKRSFNYSEPDFEQSQIPPLPSGMQNIHWIDVTNNDCASSHITPMFKARFH